MLFFQFGTVGHSNPERVTVLGKLFFSDRDRSFLRISRFTELPASKTSSDDARMIRSGRTEFPVSGWSPFTNDGPRPVVQRGRDCSAVVAALAAGPTRFDLIGPKKGPHL